MDNPQRFLETQERLNIALEKVKAKLTAYSQTPNEPHEDWNNWHDLQYRLENRLHDNYCEFTTWHWDTYGYNVYSVN